MNREQFIAHVRNEQNALRSFLLALCCGDAAEADISNATYQVFIIWKGKGLVVNQFRDTAKKIS